VELQNIIMTRVRSGANEISPSLKLYILDMLEGAGSLKYTLGAMARLDRELRSAIALVESSTTTKNPALWALLDRLAVST
jgi:hypothetical protein